MSNEVSPDFSKIDAAINTIGSVGGDVGIIGNAMDDAVSAGSAETAVQNMSEKLSAKPNPEPMEHTFTVSHTVNGRLITGTFRNKILTPLDHAKVGAYRAQLSGMIPWDALDPTTRAITEQIAHLSVSLLQKPKWAANPAEISDLTLLGMIYEEVAGHEARFRGLGDDFTGGAE